MKEWHLKKDHKYRITVSLNLLESFARNKMLNTEFEGHGFKSVKTSGKGDTRIMIGTWSGEDTLFSNEHIANVEEL